MDDGGRSKIGLEEARPMVVVTCLWKPVLVCVQADENVERNQTSVREQSEEVVTGAASWGSTFRFSHEMVDGIHCDERVPRWLQLGQLECEYLGFEQNLQQP